MNVAVIPGLIPTSTPAGAGAPTVGQPGLFAEMFGALTGQPGLFAAPAPAEDAPADNEPGPEDVNGGEPQTLDLTAQVFTIADPAPVATPQPIPGAVPADATPTAAVADPQQTTTNPAPKENGAIEAATAATPTTPPTTTAGPARRIPATTEPTHATSGAPAPEQRPSATHRPVTEPAAASTPTPTQQPQQPAAEITPGAPAAATTNTPNTDTEAPAAPTAPQSAAPAVTTATTTAPPTPPATTPPATTTSGTLHAQLTEPVRNLARQGDGTHTVTMQVTPEKLGPVTVKAHIDGEHIRIELLTPSSDGRDAVKQIIGDLRRDLAAAGMNADVQLGGRSVTDQPGHGFREQQAGGRDQGPANREPAGGRQSQESRDRERPAHRPTTTLDILA
ncbi:flagellar hook-length control protein FliK [Agromyces humi]|uniref:flagellar hook-length control protein FliK n=1 Tax=Agromyces humi TaxID=1766800 RepID=UPI00135A523F|nr:flagellar hook-length control protein FliK [Agromyces humi]